MSITDAPVVAKCVAHGLAKDGKRVVVFALDVPMLDKFSLEDSPLCPSLPAPASVDCRDVFTNLDASRRGPDQLPNMFVTSAPVMIEATSAPIVTVPPIQDAPK